MRTLLSAEEFKRRGHNVVIIAPTEGVGNINGIKVHWLHAPRKQRSSILSSLKFNVRLFRKFLAFVRTTDIFFIHNTISAASIPILRMFFKFTFVLDLTDIHAEYIVIGKRNIIEKMLAPLILAVEYWIIKSADRMITETEAMKKHLVLKGIPEEKISVVYDGAETDKMPDDKESGAEKGVIHLGSVDRQHGVEDFISAAAIVSKKHPEAVFYVVGGGRELSNIQLLARQAGVYDKCVFTDYLPCGQAREYLKKAKIGVIPRRDSLANRIITTLKLYEYWASKTAVVSSNLEGVREICTDSKDVLLFEHDNVNSLAEKISRLLEEPALTDKLIEEGYSTVKKYNWEKLIPKIVDFSLKADKTQ